MHLASLDDKTRMQRDLAWIDALDQRVFAHSDPHGHPAFSAPIQLVQGVYERFPQKAHLVLRRRLYTTAPGTSADRETVRVCAGKFTAEAARPADGPDTIDVTASARRAQARCHDHLPHHLCGRAAPSPATLLRWLDEVYGPAPHRPRPHHPRRVLALLVERGRVTWAAANDNGLNKSLHAEVILIQSHWRAHRRRLPPEAEICVSQQCCRMCAALLFASAMVPAQLRVRYLDPDPGRYAQNTLLSQRGLEGPLHSNAGWGRCR